MDTEYDNSRVERAKRGLYSPDGKVSSGRTSELSPSKVDISEDWGDTRIIASRDIPHKKTGVRILKGIIVFAVVTVLSSGGYLLYQLYSGEKPSDKNIEITFDVPVATTPGIPADIVIHINNKNHVGLEYANLSLLYPSGTRIADSPDNDLSSEKKLFGVIPAEHAVEYHTKAIFLGEENTDKEIRALLEYRFQNINSVFTKEETRQVHLLASPINLSVDTLKEINAGQTIELNVSTLSNTVIPLRDVFIKIEYPLGFTFADAEPKPTFGNNVWRVGVVDPTGKFSVKIHGVLSGEDTEERVFHTSVGVGSDRTERDIATVYSKVLSAVTLKRPFIGIGLMFGSKPAAQATAHFGENITGNIHWSNNLPTKIINAQIEVRLRGVALDRASVSAGDGGFYRSSDDTIFWDERGDANLSVIEAGSEGNVSFGFLPLPPVMGNQLLMNPTIIAEVTVRGKRVSESGVPEEIKTVITQNVKVTSQAQFAARAVYYVGPFINTGPIPPRVEQETSYTIIWSVVNTSNNLTNAEVHGILPPYMKWAGSVSPGTESIIYDHNTNQVVWSPGDIPAGTGVVKPPREVAFQVVLTPSVTQVGSQLSLMKSIGFSAVDAFTNEVFNITKSELTTALPTDPKIKVNQGFVRE